MAVLSSLRTTILFTVAFTVVQAQFFANINMDHARRAPHEEENPSEVSKLDGNSNWFDFLVANQKDSFNIGPQY